jgi:UDP-glucose 4-epimerase
MSPCEVRYAMPDAVLVTGASGLIGSRLVRRLTPQRAVVALVRGSPLGSGPDDAQGRGEGQLAQRGAPNWVQRDLAVPGFVTGLPSEIDTVVHLAQSRHFREFPEGAADVFAVNVSATMELLDWAVRIGARRFIYASSGGIYGYGAREFKEDDRIGPSPPLGYYLASKHATELLVENYGGLITIVILRFFFVYGSGQHPSMLLPRLASAVVEGRPIVLQGERGLKSNPVHVDDAVRALEAAIDLKQNEKVNVAGPEVRDLRQIGEILGSNLGKDPVFEIVPGVAPRHLIGDIGRMTALLGPPSISLKEGLTELSESLVS